MAVEDTKPAPGSWWHHHSHCMDRVAKAVEISSTKLERMASALEKSDVTKELQAIVDALNNNTQALDLIVQIQTLNNKLLNALSETSIANAKTFSQMLDELRLIQQSLPQPNLPTGLLVSEEAVQTQGENMTPQKATGHRVKIDILPNGTVRFTFTPIPAGSVLPAGTPPLSYTSSDPALSVTADPADTSGFGLLAIGTPNLPAGSTGVSGIIVTGSTTLPGASAPISGDNSDNPVNIVPAPNLPTGFAVTES